MKWNFRKVTVMAALLSSAICASAQPRVYELWENEPAPNGGGDDSIVQAGGRPFDKDWEEWSYPLGNGYMGANLFGRVDEERIQLTEKTLYNKGIYGYGGLTSFAELFLDFNHTSVTNYRRSLNLNEAISYVSYESEGVTYQREHFVSYPDNVMVIRLTADKKGALSFVVRPVIPYLDREEERTGSVVAENDLITMAGTIPFFSLNYEGQVKVLHTGGAISATKAGENGAVLIEKADAVTLIIALGTNYRLDNTLFLKAHADKCDGSIFPHEEVTARMEQAVKKGYAQLKATHLADYQNLFGRVELNLNSEVSADPTHILLEKYKAGEANTYLEELMAQYARYLLIASSREKTLPSALQGAWSQYYLTPWTGGYWHNINVQMNYWGAMNANLAETFEAYISYFKAYQPKAFQSADGFVKNRHPERFSDEPGENGWIVGTGAGAYHMGGPGGHSGPGTGAFTSKMLTEYYHFTQDKTFVKEVGYPALLSMSKFFSKALVAQEDGTLLVYPSASPEQRVTDLSTIENMPGTVDKKGYYTTTGCTFDQGFVWENHNDSLALAKAAGCEDDFLKTIEKEIPKLDPIIIGTSGQIKEFREEEAYSDIGDPKHRHISHLCGLYPGTLINSENEDWMQAARKTLDFRGNETTGWAMAHRMNCRARLKEGEKAHEVYQKFIKERTVPNLWTLHPPFQIDGNFGTMAGVMEMLIQSHEEYIELLPALPTAWKTGSYKGLVARGNFVFDAVWADSVATSFAVTARVGGECRIKYAGIASAQIKDASGKAIEVASDNKDSVKFDTQKGATYTIELK